jgi:hypothetical protein
MLGEYYLVLFKAESIQGLKDANKHNPAMNVVDDLLYLP